MALIRIITLSIVLAMLALGFGPVKAWAAAEEYRQCSVGETCEIGEFLFDDDFTPITTASCTLTTRDPAGNVLLNQAMTSHSDGWYSYEVDTTGFAYGLYRGQICCLHQSENICVDKTFEVAVPAAGLSESQVAGAVWNAQTTDHTTAGSFGQNLQNPTLSATDIWTHPQRTLTSFGTLISDIWEHSTRSLNSFSSLISGIWSHNNRTITSTQLAAGELATKSQVESVGQEVKDLKSTTETAANVQATNNEQLAELTKSNQASQNLLEQLVNKPIVETFLEDGGNPPVDLVSKIQETKRVARTIAATTNDLQKQVALLDQNWQTTNYALAVSEINAASRVLGATTQDSVDPNTLNASLDWLKQKWKSPVIGNLSLQADSALANVNNINREIKGYGKTFISGQYLNIAADHVEKIQDLIGQETDQTTSQTLFGYIAQMETVADTLTQASLEIDELLHQWSKLSPDQIEIKLNSLKQQVLAVNQIPDAETLIKPHPGDAKHRENLALALQGLIQANLAFLAHDADQVTQNLWLEHGSVKFKSLITNPSAVLAQKVTVKFYLPTEIKNEHIIKMEDGLEVKLDADKNALYVSGEFLLQPEATRIIEVEVIDVWVIPEAEIASIRKQTETLFAALKDTSYFAQGSTIKADIEVSLDKIELLSLNNQTPEVKIRSYREAMIEMTGAQTKLAALKEIVSAASSISTVFGFVGGVQALAVWGLIIILITGFVSLLIYMRTITKQTTKFKISSTPEKSAAKQSEQKLKKDIMARSENMSILALIKEIISLKMRAKGTSTNHPPLVMILLLIIGALIVFILILLFGGNRVLSSELKSPLPQLTDSSTKPQSSSTFLSQNPTINPDPARQVGHGVVLGVTDLTDPPTATSAAVNSPTQPPARTNSVAPRLAQATIPEGYQAINVRSAPDATASLTGRLYINQKVLVLQESASWVLIETVTDTDTEKITGWILQNLISNPE